MKLLTMEFSPTSRNFFPLRAKYSHHPVSKSVIVSIQLYAAYVLSVERNESKLDLRFSQRYLLGCEVDVRRRLGGAWKQV
jgi:hypothetical protein